MKFTLKKLERFMLISEDIKKQIYFNKHTNKWGWRDCGSEKEVAGGFSTFWEALLNVAGPYIGKESEDS